tara:strand:- start:168 stop:1154 length:987 start_codon:yes stop_codon:yes gene_type:complete
MALFDNWVSPNNKCTLVSSLANDSLTDGEMVFNVTDGIADLTFPAVLSKIDEKAKSFYEGRADAYDKYLHLTFKTYGEDEQVIRNEMIDLLELKQTDKVLEIACGTGRDSELIATKLSKDAELHIQDISGDMLKSAIEKLNKASPQIFASVANAAYIPYPDNYFDALYSFGGIGEFSNIKQFFQEAVRVCKPGAKIVVGDENLPIWQRHTEFGKILANYNNQFLTDVPFKDLPIEAREVNCKWIIGGVFYLLDFRVGEDEPYADFNFEIPGHRGGTHMTRYLGHLEGVTEETKNLAWQAQQKSGVSMHQWLDAVVKAEAKRTLAESDK